MSAGESLKPTAEDIMLYNTRYVHLTDTIY